MIFHRIRYPIAIFFDILCYCESWLVVWNIFDVSIYWEYHHPNLIIFFRGVNFNHQLGIPALSAQPLNRSSVGGWYEAKSRSSWIIVPCMPPEACPSPWRQ